MSVNYSHERGAVSIFSVVFATLLVTIVTVGFVQLMVRNQQQTTQNDLSRSAMDSALSGVEDAKRIIAWSQQCETSGGSVAGVNCSTLESALKANDCTSLMDVIGRTGDEVQVGQNTEDEQLRQGYTCLKIKQATFDYISTNAQRLQEGQPQIVPLRSLDNFNAVRVSWFSKTDVPEDALSGLKLASPRYASAAGGPKLPVSTSEWVSSEADAPYTPPLLRVQRILYNDTFSQSDFDSSANSAAVFLYPNSAGTNSVSSIKNEDKRSETTGIGNKPKLIACNESNLTAGGFACSAKIGIDATVSEDGGNNALLVLNAFYASTSFKVELLDGNDPVSFFNVQPKIDVTGRAGDIYRRVEARVQAPSTLYPAFAVGVTGDLCKRFGVTNSREQFRQDCVFD